MSNNRDVMRRHLDLVVAGDFEAASASYADDVVFHIAGRGPFSGDLKGRDEYFAFMGRLMGIIDSLSIEEHDLLVSDDHAVLLSRATTTQGDRSITGNSVGETLRGSPGAARR